jgi:hypothetical protein
VAKRRDNGEGSVYRRKDGLWVGQYKVQNPNGIKTKISTRSPGRTQRPNSSRP